MIIPRPPTLISHYHQIGDSYCASAWLARPHFDGQDLDERSPQATMAWMNARDRIAEDLGVCYEDMMVLVHRNNIAHSSEERIDILEQWLNQHGHTMEPA